MADRYYRNSERSTYSADIVCGECGSFVADKTQHDKFHDRLDATAQTARAADDTASMMRPIGGGF